MLTNREFELYGKYLNGAILDSEDVDDVYTLTSMGLARIGYTTSGGSTRETAILTPVAKHEYKREKALRNPVWRFLYSLFNSGF